MAEPSRDLVGRTGSRGAQADAPVVCGEGEGTGTSSSRNRSNHAIATDMLGRAIDGILENASRSEVRLEALLRGRSDLPEASGIELRPENVPKVAFEVSWRPRNRATSILEGIVKATVQDVMSHPAIFIDPDASVAHASTLMRRQGIHSLVVSMAAREYGIITTTDIRDKIVAGDRDPQKTTVQDIMTTPLITASPDWSLRECSQKMMEAGVHHLPVTDQRENIVGMISAIDIFIAVEEQGWGKAV